MIVISVYNHTKMYLFPWQDPFITKSRLGNVLQELILRTKKAVRDLDNLQYKRMKKILMGDNTESEEGAGDTNGPSSDTTEVRTLY